MEAVEQCTAVFMTGGNQVKLATLLVGTPLGDAIRTANRRGALIAGTSAGASICSRHMVSFGPGGTTPKFRISHVSEGLGLVDDVIIDQHFTQRNRFGRLLALIAANPAQLGIGIDENTAAIIYPDRTLEVKGAGVLTVVDGSDLITTAYTATGTQPLMISGLRLHSLPRGCPVRPGPPHADQRTRPAGRAARRSADRPAGRRPRRAPARGRGGSPPRVRTSPPASCAAEVDRRCRRTRAADDGCGFGSRRSERVRHERAQPRR